MFRNKEVGRFGEGIAKNYLIAKGYKIVRCNLKLGYKEIDIIARDGDILVFVEVKARLFSPYSDAEDSISHLKISHLKKAVGAYFSRYPQAEFLNIRLDLITINILKSQGKVKLKHYHDII